MGREWTIERVEGRAAEHLGRETVAGRLVRWVELTRPAVVLGSAQPEGTVDAARAVAAGIDVARRPSGGGAVLVTPGDALWAEVFLPAGDPLWSDDVRVAFHWLGRVWAGALGRLGLGAGWHDGPLLTSPWSRLVCFAGLGPGEVRVEGRKVVGLSQRRTRTHARFQCCALLRWDPAGLLGLLTGPFPDGARPSDLDGMAAGVGPQRAGDLVAAFEDEIGLTPSAAS